MIDMKPFFCYYGGKYRVAKKLYPEPKYDTIIEPFAGAAGYSVRYYQKNIILYDVNPIIFGIWDYLINVSQEEIKKLPTDIKHVDDIKSCQEAKWLVGFWLNKGTASPCKTPSAWMRSDIRRNSFWGEIIKSRISQQIEQIRHWKVYNTSYEYCDNSTSTWYIDPPYANNAGSKYKFKKIDYSKLAVFCKERNGQTIVCENEGATWLPFKELGNIKGTEGNKRSGVSKEVIWINE